MDPDLGYFGVRALEPREMALQVMHVKQMFLAALAASLTIVVAGAFFMTVLL